MVICRVRKRKEGQEWLYTSRSQREQQSNIYSRVGTTLKHCRTPLELTLTDSQTNEGVWMKLPNDKNIRNLDEVKSKQHCSPQHSEGRIASRCWLLLLFTGQDIAHVLLCLTHKSHDDSGRLFRSGTHRAGAGLTSAADHLPRPPRTRFVTWMRS